MMFLFFECDNMNEKNDGKEELEETSPPITSSSSSELFLWNHQTHTSAHMDIDDIIKKTF